MNSKNPLAFLFRLQINRGSCSIVARVLALARYYFRISSLQTQAE